LLSLSTASTCASVIPGRGIGNRDYENGYKWLLNRLNWGISAERQCVSAAGNPRMPGQKQHLRSPRTPVGSIAVSDLLRAEARFAASLRSRPAPAESRLLESLFVESPFVELGTQKY